MTGSPSSDTLRARLRKACNPANAESSRRSVASASAVNAATFGSDGIVAISNSPIANAAAAAASRCGSAPTLVAAPLAKRLSLAITRSSFHAGAPTTESD